MFFILYLTKFIYFHLLLWCSEFSTFAVFILFVILFTSVHQILDFHETSLSVLNMYFFLSHFSILFSTSFLHFSLISKFPFLSLLSPPLLLFLILFILFYFIFIDSILFCSLPSSSLPSEIWWCGSWTGFQVRWKMEVKSMIK